MYKPEPLEMKSLFVPKTSWNVTNPGYSLINDVKYIYNIGMSKNIEQNN